MNNQPRSPLMRLAWLLWNAVRLVLFKIPVVGPKLVQPPMMNMLTQSLTPFTEIRRVHGWWIDVAIAERRKEVEGARVGL